MCTKTKQDKPRVWYAIQTLYCKEERAAAFCEEQGLNCFIPMRYEETADREGNKKRKLIPAIHNLFFLEKTQSEKQIREALADCPVPLIFIRHRDTGRLYEIRDSEMVEIRAICDPDYTGTMYVDAATAEARPGQTVRVIHGNFKGLIGKLVRYKNRSYVVITVATLGVMIHIPKWYCTKIE